MSVELKDLVGEHILTGVDFSEEDVPTWFDEEEFENCSVCRFELDGVVYAAIEDPCDGYRSSMREVQVGGSISNKIPPHKVICRHIESRDDGFGSSECDTLQIIDCKTGKIVLEVGTDDIDDYYPGYVARFSPESLAVNATNKNAVKGDQEQPQ